MGSGPGPQYTIIPNDWANLEYVINDLSRIINTDSGFADFVPYTGAVGNVDLGAHSLTGSRGIFTEPTLSPFTITSNVVNTNLNADLLDGQHGSYYQVAGNYQPLATNLTSLSGLTYASTSFVKMTSAGTFGLDTATYLTAEADTLSTVMTRGATTALQLTSTYPTASGSPFAITSTTVNTNLNAELWGGYKFSDYLDQSVKQAATPTFVNLTLTDHLKIDDTLYNTLVGYGTYFSNTTGHDNTFVGYKTGYKNTEGWANTFLGLYAGYSNTTGCKNTFMGYYAGWHNTTGLGNTFLGEYAGNTNTTGNDNTFLGQESGYKNTEGYDNVFVGLHTGHENTTGYENTALGKKAGYSNTTGNENVFLGKKAGFYETGSKKLFIDNDSRTNEADGRAKALIYGIFAAATANQYLTVNGHFTALEDITDSGLTASQAVMTDANKKLVSVDYLDQSVKQAASPTFAGLTITNKLKFDDVYYNTFFGTNAAQSHTTGIFDTYVGYDVGTHGTTDYYNTGIGHAVLHNITIGHDNFGGGVYALLGLTEGVGDIGLGSSAGAGLTTGSNNLLIGTGSGQTLTVENNNVMIGPYSGLITASSSNVFIGNMSGRRQTTLGNRLIIDNQDRTSAALEITNSLIYGVFDATPANQTLRVNAALTATNFISNVAVGTSPYACTSTTLNSNLNADLLDGNHASAFQTLLTNSAGLAAALSDETGTGLAVFNNTPTLITPILGAATGTSLSLNVNSATALLVEQTGVKSNVLIVDTTNAQVGINKAPTYPFDVDGLNRARSFNVSADKTTKGLAYVFYAKQTVSWSGTGGSGGIAKALAFDLTDQHTITSGSDSIYAGDISYNRLAAADNQSSTASLIHGIKNTYSDAGQFTNTSGITVNSYGFRQATILSPIVNMSTGTLTYNHDFIEADIAGIPTLTAGSLVMNLYGYAVRGTVPAAGTSTLYVFYNEVSTADTNWNIYNNATVDNFMGLTTARTYFRDTGIYIHSNNDGHLDLTADVSIDMNGAVVLSSSLVVGTGFGCNSKTAQTAYASGGAAGGTPTLTTGYGFVSVAEMNAHTALVENIRLALVANGIMS